MTSGKHAREIHTYPEPHFFLNRKTGVCRGIYIFLFLLENIDCGYSLEPPRQNFQQFLQKIFNVQCYEPLQKLRVRLWPCKTGLSPPVILCY